MLTTQSTLAQQVQQSMHARNALYADFFERESPHLASASREMADRFLRGGRLLAFGKGAYATDAQHVSVEFVHPVIVGKRALPALDISMLFGSWLAAVLHPDDMVMGFGPPAGDPEVQAALDMAQSRGAMTFGLPGRGATYTLPHITSDPFMHQEVIEVLYHTLWETVHVFLEHRTLGQEAGDAAFLYPFLGREEQQTTSILDEVAASIRMKAADDAALRIEVALDAKNIARTAVAIRERVDRGGKLILFGNGGSATDANDWMLDCISTPGLRQIPAISLAAEPANITALANDVGTEVIFLRQLIAHAAEQDIAIGISTSGGSRNVIMALEEARRRKLLTVALLGYDGGEILRRGLADFALVVRSDYIPRIQEVQASIYHVVRELLEVAAVAED